MQDIVGIILDCHFRRFVFHPGACAGTPHIPDVNPQSVKAGLKSKR